MIKSDKLYNYLFENKSKFLCIEIALYLNQINNKEALCPSIRDLKEIGKESKMLVGMLQLC